MKAQSELYKEIGNVSNKVFPTLHNFNDMFTPPEAVDYIEPYLDRSKVYWECCYGQGHMAKELERRGFKVVGHPEMDCLKEEPETWDVSITNPPFSNNKVFVERMIQLGKPFVFLLRLEHLGGVGACRLLKDLNVSIVIPEKRINYITPKMQRGEKVGGSQFHSIWLTYGIPMERQIVWRSLTT